MNASSKEKRTRSPSFCTTGSSRPTSSPPPSSSSQLALHSMAVGSPLISERGRATGMSSPSGAAIRFS